MQRPRTRLVVGVLAATMVLAACRGDDPDTGIITIPSNPAPTDADPGPTDATVETTTTVAAPEDRAPAEIVIEADHVEGRVTGGARHEVPLGATVVVRLFSDVDEELHLHGYDVVVDVVAGQVTELRVVADLPGVWELELHDSHRRVLELAVS